MTTLSLPLPHSKKRPSKKQPSRNQLSRNQLSRNQLSKPQKAAFEVAYQQALYEVFNREQIITLKVNAYNDELSRLLQHYQHPTWTLITAYNPYSQVLSDVENQGAHSRLIKAVEPLELAYLTAVGRDASGEWPPEKSLFIMGITQTDAIALGNKFSQNAILYGTQDTPPQLIWLV